MAVSLPARRESEANLRFALTAQELTADHAAADAARLLEEQDKARRGSGALGLLVCRPLAALYGVSYRRPRKFGCLGSQSSRSSSTSPTLIEAVGGRWIDLPVDYRIRTVAIWRLMRAMNEGRARRE